MSLFITQFFSYNCLLVLPIGPCYSLVEEQQLLFPCGRTAGRMRVDDFIANYSGKTEGSGPGPEPFGLAWIGLGELGW